jgi:TonB family protein
MIPRLSSLAARWVAASLLLGAAIGPARADAPGDVPCRVLVEVPPAYPARAAKNGVTAGKARVALRIDPVGRLDDALVTAYSRPEFAEAALAAVAQWKFAPGRVDGDPAFGIIEVTFVFDANHPLANDHVGPRDETYFEGEQYQYEAVAASRLDQPPTPRHLVNPTYPGDWARRGLTGSVVVDFYIDETGRVRLPSIISADHPELGWIVLPAIVKWRFEPPTRQGRPVLVRAEQTFQF